MANLRTNEGTNPFSFSDFPEDVQLCILSFLTPSEVSTFASTSKRFLSLCRNDGKLWFALCDRRWGSKTQINKWGNGKVTYRQLYKTLNEYENLIGFWRRSGQGKNAGDTSPPLVFFEWGSSFVTGSRVSPSKTGTYQVIKGPFLWLSIMPDGAIVSFFEFAGGEEGWVSEDFEFGECEGGGVWNRGGCWRAGEWVAGEFTVDVGDLSVLCQQDESSWR